MACFSKKKKSTATRKASMPSQSQGTNDGRNLNRKCRYDVFSRVRYARYRRAMSSITSGSRVKSLLNLYCPLGNVSGRFYIWPSWKGGKLPSLPPWKLEERGRQKYNHFFQSVFVINLYCFTRITLGFIQSSIHWWQVSIWKISGWRGEDSSETWFSRTPPLQRILWTLTIAIFVPTT